MSNKTDVTYKEILNDIEADKIIGFCQDRILFEAVKKYVLFYLYQHIAKPGEKFKGNSNYALQLAWDRTFPRTNEELGADLRALARGIQAVESGFIELESIKKEQEKPVEEQVNPAL